MQSGTQSNETRSPVKPVPNFHDVQSIYTPSHRRPLSDVSPNVKPVTPSATPGFLKRPLTGSPLKRSFNAAMESGEGLTYLKRRRLGENELLSEFGAHREREASMEIGVQPLPPLSGVMVDVHSPTEPNTPPSEDNASTEGSSAERKSFSSLINYDPSSQPSNLTFPTVSQAELLKLRLRVAMYKVRTNQVAVPFPELHVESDAKKNSTQQAIEDAVAQLRKEAQEVLARSSPQPSYPTLLPAPVLQPTAYSSRMIYDTNLHSSPPTSRTLNRLPMTIATATPLRAMWRTDSPPTSAQRLFRPSEQELTSSVVKGRVAEGLLGLKYLM